MPELAISAEKVNFLIVKAREFDGEDLPVDTESGSNGADDRMVAVLEDGSDHPVRAEIAGFISALTEDEQVDLVALMRLGRGDASIDEWAEIRLEAARARNNRTAEYLLGEPMLGDLLAEGLSQFEPEFRERITPVS